jgi:hypothetical protein
MHVFLLKYFDVDDWAREHSASEGHRLPYALEILEDHGIELRWSDRARRPP